ncbi:response regulator [Geminicoccus harenae]|uniref:response regulator n=1 Tax=Geminicoccus harenae TaxID=2498453 RepID=UPI00168BC7AC|nr:response regulator [Geminicoccus harenae]
MVATRQVILVVEDEPLLRLAAVDMVEDAGFEAVSAANAAQAISILENRNDIRLVFSDIDMLPGMDGIKLAAYIRDRWPPIAIILTSGIYASTDVTLPPNSLFFSKPYVERDILRAARRMIA